MSEETTAPFCGQRDPNYPDDGCCTLEPGHSCWQNRDGEIYDHARLESGTGAMITAWNAPDVPTGFCEAMSPGRGARCQLSNGHRAPIDTDGEQFDHAAPSLGVWWHNPPCPGTALPARADQPVRRCTKGLGHKGACADDAGELLGEDATPTFGEQDRAVTRCEATYGTSAHQCTGAAGHADDHTAYSAATGDLEWSDADNAAKLPQREPGAAYDHEALLRELFDGVPGAPGRLKVLPLTPQPVRVRFVDLPHRHREVPAPYGGLTHIAEPGGFALVVDRFKNLAHLEGERVSWNDFGAKIGAHCVVLYPGELDVVGWLDNA